MAFKDEYTSATKKEAGKTQLSDETYAFCTLMDLILEKLEHIRITWH